MPISVLSQNGKGFLDGKSHTLQIAEGVCSAMVI